MTSCVDGKRKLAGALGSHPSKEQPASSQPTSQSAQPTACQSNRHPMSTHCVIASAGDETVEAATSKNHKGFLAQSTYDSTTPSTTHKKAHWMGAAMATMQFQTIAAMVQLTVPTNLIGRNLSKVQHQMLTLRQPR